MLLGIYFDILFLCLNYYLRFSLWGEHCCDRCPLVAWLVGHPENVENSHAYSYRRITSFLNSGPSAWLRCMAKLRSKYTGSKAVRVSVCVRQLNRIAILPEDRDFSLRTFRPDSLRQLTVT